MHINKIFVLSSAAVIAFDAIASVASLVLKFPYSYAAVGSALLYLALTLFASRKIGFWPSVLLGAAMGLTDVTIGWAISWAIGPGRLPSGMLTALTWLYTALLVVVLGIVYGLIGGGLGAVTKRGRAA